MNILITGSSGVIATQLIKYFKELDKNVYTLSRHKDADYLVDLSSLNIDFEIVDVKIDVIIHCAFVIPKSFDEDSDEIFRKNKIITDNTVRLVDKIKPKQIINISSIALYPNVSGCFTENSDLNPEVNWNKNYGNSKLYVENTFTELINKTCDVCHLRVSQLLADDLTDTLQKNFLQELKEKNTITVFANGKRESNFIFTSKLCSVIDQVIDKSIEGVYNCGDFQQNYLDFAENFIVNYGNDNSKIVLVDKGTPTIFRLNCTKLLKALN
ncbi:MAG: NAD-dependent epimerase/dehydratase family protein [Vicingaceae bacterium]